MTRYSALRRPPLAPECLDAPGAFIRLVNVEPTKNRFRFYSFTCQPTLWGEWAIRCTWGRIGGVGRSRLAYLGDREGVPEALLAGVEHRLRRGYWPDGSPAFPPAAT